MNNHRVISIPPETHKQRAKELTLARGLRAFQKYNEDKDVK